MKKINKRIIYTIIWSIYFALPIHAMYCPQYWEDIQAQATEKDEETSDKTPSPSPTEKCQYSQDSPEQRFPFPFDPSSTTPPEAPKEQPRNRFYSDKQPHEVSKSRGLPNTQQEHRTSHPNIYHRSSATSPEAQKHQSRNRFYSDKQSREISKPNDLPNNAQQEHRTSQQNTFHRSRLPEYTCFPMTQKEREQRCRKKNMLPSDDTHATVRTRTLSLFELAIMEDSTIEANQEDSTIEANQPPEQ